MTHFLAWSPSRKRKTPRNTLFCCPPHQLWFQRSQDEVSRAESPDTKGGEWEQLVNNLCTTIPIFVCLMTEGWTLRERNKGHFLNSIWSRNPSTLSWFKSGSALARLVTSVCTSEQAFITQCTLGQLRYGCFCYVATCIQLGICTCPFPCLPSYLEEWPNQQPACSPARCSSPCTSRSDCGSTETIGVCHLCGLVLNPLSPLTLKKKKSNHKKKY